MAPRRSKGPNYYDCIDAIVARDQNASYATVLYNFGLSPKQFFSAVSDLFDLAQLATGPKKRILEALLEDEGKRIELFRMGEKFIYEQYTELMAMKSLQRYANLPTGITLHPENIEFLVYVALTLDKPKLASSDRHEVIESIKGISRLQSYIRKLGLGGIVHGALSDSYWNVLLIFNEAYQHRTGDASLFDLSHPEHIHPWGDNVRASSLYWNTYTASEAIIHILVENNPALGSNERTVVVNGLKSLPKRLQEYLNGLGLDSPMEIPPFNGSSWAVLGIFNEAYQHRTGDASLFDLSHPEHIHPWGGPWHAPPSYWLDHRNVTLAVYHTLSEEHPLLSSSKKGEVQDGIRSLPRKLDEYFSKILPGCLYRKLSGPKRVLQTFDDEYQRKTGDTSLLVK